MEAPHDICPWVQDKMKRGQIRATDQCSFCPCSAARYEKLLRKFTKALRENELLLAEVKKMNEELVGLQKK
jgi:hypothetical protein